MLPSLPFEGTAKVFNKGVDITFLTDEQGANTAYEVSRYLSVRGISAAVLVVTELYPVDMRTIHYYEEMTRTFFFLKPDIYNAVVPCLETQTRCWMLKHQEVPELLREALTILQ